MTGLRRAALRSTVGAEAGVDFYFFLFGFVCFVYGDLGGMDERSTMFGGPLSCFVKRLLSAISTHVALFLYA